MPAASPRILIHLDHNPHPRVFDAIMSLDAGVDHVIPYGDVEPPEVPLLVSGALYSRPLEELARTALLVTGTSDLVVRELVRQACRTFFGAYRISILSECKGGNAVAGAAVARIAALVDLSATRFVVLGGGPVGARVAALLVAGGATGVLTAFDAAEAEERTAFARDAFGVAIETAVWKSGDSVGPLVEGATAIVTAGPPGLPLLPRAAWEAAAGLELLVDVSGADPAGIEGLTGEEDGEAVAGGRVRALGGLAISRWKIVVHHAAVARLYAGPEPVVLGPAEVAAIARDVVGAGR